MRAVRPPPSPPLQPAPRLDRTPPRRTPAAAVPTSTPWTPAARPASTAVRYRRWRHPGALPSHTPHPSPRVAACTAAQWPGGGARPNRALAAPAAVRETQPSAPPRAAARRRAPPSATARNRLVGGAVSREPPRGRNAAWLPPTAAAAAAAAAASAPGARRPLPVPPWAPMAAARPRADHYGPSAPPAHDAAASVATLPSADSCSHRCRRRWALRRHTGPWGGGDGGSGGVCGSGGAAKEVADRAGRVASTAPRCHGTTRPKFS
ncbi:hypothetical protein BU14_0356s0013 [Porphyra umbilicalis]|uniref:Uncharacterized protein n=1 Tax=Porphyra umbilicalis TaxID=2786 RepID=A0A1X6NXP1_PORUM|nr:hypothetical protein BU14_0356s0013 [Porphyra umbilicalis]|eukprot:OSX73347.1 hypothetical protein BU14_0356s0013 [Porphyra umbilicalis]